MKFKAILRQSQGIIWAIVAMLLCYFSASIELWHSSASEEAIALRPSAFIYSLEPILFGGVIYLFPFCACLPVLMKKKVKSPTSKLTLETLLHTFTSGGVAVAIPFIFHTILWNILAVPVNPAQYESHQLQLYGLLNNLYDKFYGIPVYMIFFCGMFLCGGVYAIMALAFRSTLPDQVVAFMLPAVIYFFWLKLSTTLSIQYFPAPVDLFDEGITVENIPISIIVYLLLLIIFSTIYYISDRSIRRDE